MIYKFRLHFLIALSLLFVVISIVFALPKNEPSLPSTLQLIIKPNFAFHNTRQLKITLQSNHPQAKIYYTLDSTEPNLASNSTQLYQGPIILNQRPTHTTGIIVRAQAFAPAPAPNTATTSTELTTPIITKTLFWGEDVHRRFKNPIVSLVTNPENLYNYETGILIEGKTRDDYLTTHPEMIDQDLYFSPANYYLRGRDSERPAHVEFFENSNAFLSQDIGIRLHGFGSRTYDQKSFKLIARKIYDPENGKLKYPFFIDLVAQDENKTPISTFDRLVLRSPYNYDRNATFIRDELGGLIAKNAGFPDYQPSVPVTVFLNGDYYQLAWLKPNFDEEYLSEKYQSGDDKQFQILETGDSKEGFILAYIARIQEEDQWTPEEDQILKELNNLIHADFQDPAVLAKIEQTFDLDNVLLYYAINIALDNIDWPENNYKMWRYTGTPQPDKPGFDGKWRFLMFDFDRIYNKLLPNSGGHFMTHEVLFELQDTQQKAGYFLNQLLEVPHLREQFFNNINDLQGNLLNRASLEDLTSQKSRLIKHEVQQGIEAGIYDTWMVDIQIDHFIRELIDYSQKLNFEVKQHLIKYFNLNGRTYEVQVQGAQGVTAYLNHHLQTYGQAEDKLQSQYFIENQATISAQTAPFYQFEGWQLNGEFFSDQPEITVDYEMINGEGKVLLQPLATRQTTNLPLIINEIGNHNQDDWIEIYNPNQNSVNLAGYCLTDNYTEQPCRWEFPDLALAGDSVLTLYSQDNQSPSRLRRLFFNFNLGYDEILTLSDQHGQEIIDQVAIPRLNADLSYAFDQYQGYYRLSTQPTPNAPNEF